MAERPEPYKWQTRIRSIISVVLGIVFALFPVKIALHLSPSLSTVALIVVYAGSAILLGIVARLAIDQFAELDKQIPISSQERRRRTKEFLRLVKHPGPALMRVLSDIANPLKNRGA